MGGTLTIRALDLFCGAGGSSFGARDAGAEIVCGVDAWELAVKTYADNFHGAKAVRATLDARATRKVVGEIGKIDLILASPECTNHTCAKGSTVRNENSRRTAMFVLNYARTFKPRWIVIENVVQMERWSRYEELINVLRADYQVTTQKIDAHDHAVPQNRRRLFIMCDREVKPPLVKPTVNGHKISVLDILDRDGKWNSSPLETEKRAAPTIERANRALEALGPDKDHLIVYYGNDGAGGWQTLDRPLRTVTTVDRFGLVRWKDGRRTLRMLQVPELLRAMGFDERYEMNHGSRRDKIKMLGNGVCPPVMKSVVRTLLGRN